MAAPMYKMQVQHKDLIITLALEESILCKFKTEENFIALEELFSYLIEHGALTQAGLPNDVNVADIRLLSCEAMFPDPDPVQPIVINEDENAIQSSKQKGAQDEVPQVSQGPFVWGDASIKLLLACVDKKKAHRAEFRNKQQVWELIAMEMAEEGFSVSWEAVSKKWVLLQETYKKLSEQKRLSGNAPKWVYYPTLDKMLSDSTVKRQGGTQASLSKTVLPSVNSKKVTVKGKPRVYSKDPVAWSDESIRHLLYLVDDSEVYMQNHPLKQKETWEEIAEKMMQKGYKVYTGDIVSRKWSQLLETYHNIVQKQNQTGNMETTWKYFSIFDEMVGASSSGVQSQEGMDMVLLEASVPSGSQTNIGHTPERIVIKSEIDFSPQSSPTSPYEKLESRERSPCLRRSEMRKRRKLQGNGPATSSSRREKMSTLSSTMASAPDWFREYCEWKERSEDEWHGEFKTMMNERTKAIEKLTNAINGLIQVQKK